MRKTRHKRKPLLFKLTRRTILFLFLFLFSSLALYTIGNYQFFLDSSQKIIINLASVTSSAFILLCLAGSGECIFYMIQKKEERFYFLFHFIFMLFLAFLGIFIQIALHSLSILSNGI